MKLEGREIKSLKKISKTTVWSFSLCFLLFTTLFAEEKKTLSPAPPEAQKECDQNQFKATEIDSSNSSPMALTKDKNEDVKNLLPPPLKVQENKGSGG